MSASQTGRGRDERAGSHPAGSEDFESGLDYGSFVEEEPDADRTQVLSREEIRTAPGPAVVETRTPDRTVTAEQDIVASRPVPRAAPAETLALERDYPRDGYAGAAPAAWAGSAPDGSHAAGTTSAPVAGAGAEERARLPKAGPRIAQTLLAVLAPFVALLTAVKLVASPLFLWLEYHRPGFPGDRYGFTTDDRMHYGSAGLDYLNNLAGTRYLSSLTDGGAALFTDAEVAHMADVKTVMLWATVALVVLAVLCALLVMSLLRSSPGGVRRALFAAAVWFLIALIALAVLAVLGWSTFFAGFHQLFFADGTWTFSVQDALIRLYPGQFWVDAAAAVGLLSLLTALITLMATWPTRWRREKTADQRAALEATRLRWAREQDAAAR